MSPILRQTVRHGILLTTLVLTGLMAGCASVEPIRTYAPQD